MVLLGRSSMEVKKISAVLAAMLKFYKCWTEWDAITLELPIKFGPIAVCASVHDSVPNHLATDFNSVARLDFEREAVFALLPEDNMKIATDRNSGKNVLKNESDFRNNAIVTFEKVHRMYAESPFDFDNPLNVM